MFFGTRSSASKITDRMGLAARSPEAKVLIRLISWSEKQIDEMLGAVRKPALPKIEGELGAAVAMARNASAVAEVGRVIHIDLEKARQLLERCRDAAADIASEEGLTEIVMTAARDRAVAGKGA